MNKKGAIKGGWIILIAVLLVLAYTQGYLDFILKPTPVPVADGRCPSSGLTEVTINTQEALASSATNSDHNYYVFDKSGVLIANGNSGVDGQSIFDVKCGVNKKYDVIVLNETKSTGFYAETFEIVATESTFVKNLQTYEYGQVNIANIGSDADPTGKSNISSGSGKNCGFTITYTENETASAYNKPLIVCQANVTGVLDITLTGATRADSKKPTRLALDTATNGWWVFEVDKMILSTDAAQKISGKITFPTSTTPYSQDNMSCQITDQATYKKVDYKTLSLDEGFVVGAEDDSNAEIGGDDSIVSVLWFNHADGYC